MKGHCAEKKEMDSRLSFAIISKPLLYESGSKSDFYHKK